MKTVVIEILEPKVMKILETLEELGLIKIHKGPNDGASHGGKTTPPKPSDKKR